MRISLQRKAEKWTLSDMDDLHLSLLRQVAKDASYSQSAEGRARLFPRPLDGAEAETEEEFIKDWNEYVVEDLEDKFSADVRTLLDDLSGAKKQSSSTDEAGPRHRVTLPLSHGPAWFSALNQARLMLDQRYKFYDEHDHFVPVPPDGPMTETHSLERFDAYMRDQFYCTIQEWLVRHVL